MKYATHLIRSKQQPTDSILRDTGHKNLTDRKKIKKSSLQIVKFV